MKGVLKGQRGVIEKVTGENEEMVGEMARKEVGKMEMVKRQRETLESFESVIHERSSYLSASELHRKQLISFKTDMSRLQK